MIKELEASKISKFKSLWCIPKRVVVVGGGGAIHVLLVGEHNKFLKDEMN